MNRSSEIPSTTLHLPIVGMSCASCSGKVERKLASLAGVKTASVDLAAAKATVTGTTGFDELVVAIKETGYDVATVTDTFLVQGLSCASCVAKTEKALTAVPGVFRAEVDLTAGKVSVLQLRETVPFRQLQKAVRNVGYDLLQTSDASDAPTRPDRGSTMPYLVGTGGALGLFLVFFGFITVTDSLQHAWQLFARMWFWVFLLAAGFGTQLGLFAYLRHTLRKRQAAGASAGVAASGGVSTLSMLACCAHLVPGFLSLLGLSAVSVILAQYQMPFILLGVFSNLVGITIMLGLIQSHGLIPESGFAKSVFRLSFVQVRNAAIALAVIVVTGAFLTTDPATARNEMTGMAKAQKGSDNQVPAKKFTLSEQTNQDGSVQVRVTPLEVRYGAPLAFSVSLNTHSGSLDVDLARSSVLVDGQGHIDLPTGWEGDPPGGHHRSGKLLFPPLREGTWQIKLIIKNVNRIPERVFQWTLS